MYATCPRDDHDGPASPIAEPGTVRRRTAPSATRMASSPGLSPTVPKTISDPSGDHEIVSSTCALPISRALPPPTPTTHTPRAPPRSDTKATHLPSAENAG